MDEKKLKEIEHMKEKHQDKEWIHQVISREKALDKLEEELRVFLNKFGFFYSFPGKAKERNKGFPVELQKPNQWAQQWWKWTE